MQRSLNLRIFPAVFSEGLGLGKFFILANNQGIKYQVAMRLFHPIMNLFRGDVEEDLFSIVIFGNRHVAEEVRKVMEKLRRGNSNFVIYEVSKTRKFSRDPSCFNPTSGKWTCEGKVEFKQGSVLPSPDEKDVNGIVTLQVNPFADVRTLSHRFHIRKIITGFMYTLGKKEFVVQLITKDDISDEAPDLIWIAEGDEVFISELHVDRKGLEEVSRKFRASSIKMIISPMSPLYALGYSIPVEIFRNRSWDYPRIEAKIL
ncbi:hypothetical protein GWK48_08470 [Metallosphaera tengchongensis]|uniref:Uncharacterized protein n=2 Tax=Metallosphaera tengchongensis TaxID=1532350 RepID=A0A6N0NXZ5_9CREN|nr:hypothetical protein GWK48_08470 [Metallosphaera tengchongensis]